MTKKEYRALVAWTVVLIVSLSVGFALLFCVWRPGLPVLCLLVALCGIVIAMLLYVLGRLREDVDMSQLHENSENLQ